MTGMAEYIELETAIETIMSEPTDAHYPSWYADKIKEIPAADVAPVRHGQWERDERGSYLRRCSVCKKPPVYQDERRNSVAVYAGVCINCGAKMDGDVDA